MRRLNKFRVGGGGEQKDYAFTASRKLDSNEQMFTKCCCSHAVSAVAVAVDPVAAAVAAVPVAGA
jgi:hypothetical protein